MNVHITFAQETDSVTHHSADEIVYKKPLTRENIAVWDALVKRNTVSTKFKGDRSSSYKESIKGWSGKKIKVTKGHINHNGDTVEHIHYPTVGLNIKTVNGELKHQHYQGFIPIDTTRKLLLATFYVDDSTDTYVFTEDVKFERLFEHVDLFIKYEGDKDYVPLGRHGKNLEPLLAFDPIPNQRFMKYRNRAIWGARIVLAGFVQMAITFPLLGTPVALLGVGTLTAIGAPLIDRTERHVVSAISLYNSLLEK